jgi:D-ribulokinase
MNALGIDFGTSGARAVIVDAAGEIQATARHTFTGTSSCEIWRCALESLLAQLPLDLRQSIQRIAIDGTSSTVCLTDATGTPLLPPLMYDDSRAQGHVAHLGDLAPPGHVVLIATSSLAKLLWFLTQVTLRETTYLLHQADWIAFLFHGQLGWSDEHNALKLGYDVAERRYPEWLQGLVLPPQLILPTVAIPGTPIGVVTPAMCHRWGFPASCQVCAGTTDSMAAFLACGVSTPGQAVTSLGSTLVLKLLSTQRVDAAQYGVYSHRLGDQWLVGGASNTGGAVLKQFFRDTDLYTLSAAIDVSLPSPYDYYPLTRPGERFPYNDPGLLPRLEPRPTDPVAFLYGLLSGMARIEQQGYALLQTLGATPLTAVYSAGGGAQNPTWTALREKYLGVPLLTARYQEAAYGAALLALGRWGEAPNKMEK